MVAAADTTAGFSDWLYNLLPEETSWLWYLNPFNPENFELTLMFAASLWFFFRYFLFPLGR